MSKRPDRVRLFTAPDSWSGGDYELYIELGHRFRRPTFRSSLGDLLV